MESVKKNCVIIVIGAILVGEELKVRHTVVVRPALLVLRFLSLANNKRKDAKIRFVINAQ